MAVAKINKVLTQFPPAPDSATDNQADFNTKADAFVRHQADSYVGDVNTWATEANALSIYVNDEATRATVAADRSCLAGDDADRAEAEADRAEAAANAIHMPSVTGNANKFLKVKADESTTEWSSVAIPINLVTSRASGNEIRVSEIVGITQANYDSIGSKHTDKLYVIIG